MKTFLGVVVTLAVLLVVATVIVYSVGSHLPVDHVTTVSDMIQAPPAKVFGLITDVAHAPEWRHAVKSVEVLPSDGGRDHWIENLGHGVKMNFLATETSAPPVATAGISDEQVVIAHRSVLLKDPQYGGTWLYQLAETRTNDGAVATQLTITESGYINPPAYRFMMAYVFGMKKNLDQYMTDMKAAVK